MWDGDLTGEVVDGRYELGTLYGSGGMAEVYRALDTRLDRTVAIKFFQGEASGEDRIRLDREAQVLGAMHCPGLVEVYGTGVFRGRPYFVMQAVEGGTLRRRMRGAMAPEIVATVGAQIAGVLAHVHAQDVVHRDVKPSNILLDTEGRRAYLADFGLALQGQVTRVTRSGVLVGTAGYLAPEQVRGGDVLPAADVYALGLVLLECLTGRPEYPGGDTEAALSRLHREPRIPANLPEQWTAVLTGMTASDPAKRPAAAECERLLEEAARASVGLPPLVEVDVVDRAEVGVAAVGGPAVGGAAVVDEPRKGRNRAVLVGTAAAAGVLALLSLVTLGDAFAPGSGEQAGRTTTAPAPVAEQAAESGVADPNSPPALTNARDGARVEPSGSTADDTGGGVAPTSGTGTTTTTTTAPADGGEDDGSDHATSKPRKEPVDPPTNVPVVITPVPVTPTQVGPPAREGAVSGRG
ncbi:serine/threonine-protein kinase [Saccharothrix sp. NRRL B-16314]|uniref:serine/threonine-protein kinase n=1 Tax=Saccharothrix sp. NRRL B-16314 TaxID=1463825 RepID=UPI0006914AF7|nr:serine/threonine-protein kinase [Saccharothrix sp. NRRL B-16314]